MPGLILGTGQLDVDLLGPVASGSAPLGGITASAVAEVENLVSASAPLGGLTVTAAAVVTTFATASSSFGALVAEANTIPTPPTPPTPEGGTSAGAGMPNFVQPNFPTTQEVEKVVATATAVAMAKIPALKANALARIDFSILADDEEVLLLI
jgi:hypothetical protein